MNHSKSLVYLLIFLLTCTSIVSLYQPTSAEDGWTDITSFPYTIDTPGNYRVTTTWDSTTGTSSAITINADDVVVDGQNYLLNLTYTSDYPSGVYSTGHSNILIENLNVTNGYYAIRLVSCTNFTVNGCSSTKCMAGLSTNACYDFNVNSYNSTKDIMLGITFFNCHSFTLDSSNVYYVTSGNNGIYAYGSFNFLATNLTISRCYSGLVASWCNDYMLRDSSINRTGDTAFWGGNGQNVTITNCTFDLNSGDAIYAWLLTDLTVNQCTITNNSIGINVASCTGVINNNYIATNGIYTGNFYGGIYAQDNACDITGNTFERNYDALIWVPEDIAVTSTSIVSGNWFMGNSYTFSLDYVLPLGSTNQKLVFSNNLVNDTAYFDSSCFHYCTLPIADGVFSLNSTMQLGTRPYSNGPQTSGNFWTHPDGTGISLTGTDADKDGFIDTTFELFNDATIATTVDYHPYSTQFDSNNWVSFTLPAVITQPGKYKIASSWTGDEIGLIIRASNVTVDGQTNLIQLTAQEPAILLQNSTNIILKNINETGALHGVYSDLSTFTIQDSLFTNNTELGIASYYSENSVIQNTRISNNTYGFAAIYSHNLTVNGCQITNNTMGLETLYTNNFTLSNSYLTRNEVGAGALFFCKNSSVLASNFIDNLAYGLILQSSHNITINNCNIINSQERGLYTISSDFNAANCNINNNTYGLYGFYSNFNVTSTSLSNNGEVGVFSVVSDGVLRNSNVSFNGGCSILCSSGNLSVTNCNLSNNVQFGVEAINCPSLVFKNSTISNHTYVGLAVFNSNLNAEGNTFADNGKNIEDPLGGLIVEESNCTVTRNTFTNNYDALLVGIYTSDLNYTQIYSENRFQNNSYTFDFNYHLPSNYTNQQIYFYNNLVNDTAYVNPASFALASQFVPPSTVLHLNTTAQAGARIYGVGGTIGGNYWAHPNGTGPSQTGVDLNRDGFIDTKFDLFGNATLGIYDCLPLSTNYTATLTFTAGTSQTIGVNQMSNVFTVQATDAFGNITYGLTVNLASSCVTGSFYSDSAGTKQITSITLPANSSSASFYYRDSAWGDRTITVFAPYANSATTPLTIPSPASSSTSTSNSSPSSTAIPTATPTPAPTPITGIIQVTKQDNTQLTLTISGNIAPTQFSNISLTANQTVATTYITFTVTGETGSSGFCNITIPKNSIPYGQTPAILIDMQPAANQGYTEDAENYYVWFTTSFSTHYVTVRFSNEPMPTNITGTSNAYWWATPVAAIIGIALVSIVIAVQMKRRTRR